MKRYLQATFVVNFEVPKAVMDSFENDDEQLYEQFSNHLPETIRTDSMQLVDISMLEEG